MRSLSRLPKGDAEAAYGQQAIRGPRGQDRPLSEMSCRVYTLKPLVLSSLAARDTACTTRTVERRQASVRRRLFDVPLCLLQVLLRQVLRHLRLTILFRSDASSRRHARSRAKGHSEEDSEGKRIECMGRESRAAGPPRLRSSQHRASHFPPSSCRAGTLIVVWCHA